MFDNRITHTLATNTNHESTNALLAYLPGLVFYKNIDLIYLAATNYAARLCGFADNNQFSGHNDFELRCAAAESAQEFRDEDTKVIQTAKEISCLQIHQFADGKIHIFLLRKAPVKNTEGIVIGVCSIGNEVAEPGVGQAIFNLLELGKPAYKNIYNLTFEVNSNEIFNQLSAREAELTFYLIRGFTTKDISAFMDLSPRTVESYLETIKNKFNCNSKNELLLFCMHNGFSYIIPQSILRRCVNKSISW
jgi:DNA-binding CsgD family transcriptional regulator